MNNIVHEIGITLSEEERSYLSKTSWSLNKQIRRIMKKYPKGFTYYEMLKVLEQAHGNMNIDTVRRGISQQTDISSRLQELEDKYGRMPLVKTDEKRLNPDTNTSISVYAYNERYGKPPNNAELLREHRERGQYNFYEMMFGGKK